MARIYAAIDLKSFYASCECVERGLDPLTAHLVVADYSRTEKTICLAVSPALKQAIGVGGRARLYEVLARARAKGVDFELAPPQMKRYMEVSRQIYRIYTRFVAPTDIHVYSIDEVFMDITDYLKINKMSAREFVGMLMNLVLAETGITATAGVGTNLYLAKVAMDIVAKRIVPGEGGARIAELDEMNYRRHLWNHTPLTDFWRIGPGYQRRLAKLGIYSMGDLARYSLVGAEKLYKVFGVNAELLIDHAWGWEPVQMSDIKNCKAVNHSLTSGQVLQEPYDYAKARLVVWEMADALALDMFKKGVAANQMVLTVGYDVSNTGYADVEVDRYGRKVPKSAHGTINLSGFTNLASEICDKILMLYDEIVVRDLTVRRIYVVANHVKLDNGEKELVQMDIFTNYEEKKAETEREKRLLSAEIKIRERYGKNALIKAANLEDGATMRSRNMQVGGHRA